MHELHLPLTFTVPIHETTVADHCARALEALPGWLLELTVRPPAGGTTNPLRTRHTLVLFPPRWADRQAWLSLASEVLVLHFA